MTQTWNAPHIQIDEGRMDGYVRSVDSDEPMGYWTEDMLPFAYSFARRFTLANRWFCSAPWSAAVAVAHGSGGLLGARSG
jgi:phospholipase C